MLVPRENNITKYYPAVSNDDALVVYNQSTCGFDPDVYTNLTSTGVGVYGAQTCDGYDDSSATLVADHPDGRAPQRLDNANGGPTSPTTTRGRAGARTTARSAGTKLYWLAFSSRRPYGLQVNTGAPLTTKPQLWFAAVLIGSETVLGPELAAGVAAQLRTRRRSGGCRTRCRRVTTSRSGSRSPSRSRADRPGTLRSVPKPCRALLSRHSSLTVEEWRNHACQHARRGAGARSALGLAALALVVVWHSPPAAAIWPAPTSCSASTSLSADFGTAPGAIPPLACSAATPRRASAVPAPSGVSGWQVGCDAAAGQCFGQADLRIQQAVSSSAPVVARRRGRPASGALSALGRHRLHDSHQHADLRAREDPALRRAESHRDRQRRVRRRRGRRAGSRVTDGFAGRQRRSARAPARWSATPTISRSTAGSPAFAAISSQVEAGQDLALALVVSPARGRGRAAAGGRGRRRLSADAALRRSPGRDSSSHFARCRDGFARRVPVRAVSPPPDARWPSR